MMSSDNWEAQGLTSGIAGSRGSSETRALSSLHGLVVLSSGFFSSQTLWQSNYLKYEARALLLKTLVGNCSAFSNGSEK